MAGSAGEGPVFIQKIVSEKPSASELFGQSVSIEKGRLAIGAPNPGGVSYNIPDRSVICHRII